MTCPHHTAPQSFCARCAEVTAMSSSQMTVVSWPARLIEPVAGAAVVARWDAVMAGPAIHATTTTRHDASAARIAGLEANVNEKLATIAALRSQLRETELCRRDASALITDITDAVGVTGSHRDIDDRDAPAAVSAVFNALRDEIAQLRSVESVAIAAARVASLAAALLVALADVDPKAMSTYEQQAARRHARALLEEVGR